MRLNLNPKFVVKYNEDKALKALPILLARELKGTMRGLGGRLRDSAQKRMRSDTGESAKSLKVEVTGSAKDLSFTVTVYSTLLKAFIDAYGMRPGTMVPFGYETRLRQWASRKIRSGHSKQIRNVTSVYSGHGPHRLFQGEQAPLQGVNKLTKRGRIPRRVKRAGKAQRVQMRSDKNRTNRFAFAVAKKIFEHGIRASSWNRLALEANRKRIINDLQNAMSRTVNKVNRG